MFFIRFSIIFSTSLPENTGMIHSTLSGMNSRPWFLPAIQIAVNISAILALPDSYVMIKISSAGRYSTGAIPFRALSSARTASGQPLQVKPPCCSMPLTLMLT